MEMRFYNPAVTPVMTLAAVTDRADYKATDNAYGNGTMTASFPIADDEGGRVTPRCIAVVGSTPYVISAVTRDHDAGTVTVSACELLGSMNRIVVDPSDRYVQVPGRIIKAMLDDYSPYPMTVTVENTGENSLWVTNFGALSEEIKNVIDTFHLMTHTVLTDSGIALHVTTGTDKTGIVLSDERGTATLLRKTHDIKDYANKAIVYSTLDPADHTAPEVVTAAQCGFTDGINDAEYGVREIGVYKFAEASMYLYETADGYSRISRANLMKREGKAALATHRPKIGYEMKLTETGAALGLMPGDCVTADGRTVSVVSRTRTPDSTVLTLRV